MPKQTSAQTGAVTLIQRFCVVWSKGPAFAGRANQWK